MKNLDMMALDDSYHLAHPEEFDEIEMRSPALALLTDFRQHHPAELDGDTPGTQAEFLMRKSHVKLLLVVDKEEELIGIVSHGDLDDQKFILQQDKGFQREDILVKHLMQPRALIKGLNYRQLQNASVEDVVHALQKNRQQYCLVLDPDEKHICGVISAMDIASRLHIPLTIEGAPTFGDIFEAVKPSSQ
jgi:CBS domain-containing protein